MGRGKDKGLQRHQRYCIPRQVNAISPQKAGPFHFYYTTDNIAERRR